MIYWREVSKPGILLDKSGSCTKPVTNPAFGLLFVSASGEKIIVTDDDSKSSINLSDETLSLASYNAYSLDGGLKWKTGTLSDADFAKALSKDVTLWLTNGDIDSKTKKPVSDSAVTKFKKIQARPSAPKLSVNYAIGADLTGFTTGDFVLTAKNGNTAVKNGIEIAEAEGKAPDSNGYGKFYDGTSNGIPIKALEGSKVVKTAYYVRIAPTTTSAASKPAKISVSCELKPTKYKANYKTEIIKLKKGDLIYAGTDTSLDAIATVVSGATANLASGQLISITNAKGAEVSLADYLTTAAQTIIIWKAGTDKKAPTAKQVYTLAPRASITDVTIDGVNGKITIPNTYEIRVNSAAKWGKLPKITMDMSFDIRVKATAKGTGTDDSSGFAASETGDIDVVYGVYKDAPEKRGIISAAISQ